MRGSVVMRARGAWLVMYGAALLACGTSVPQDAGDEVSDFSITARPSQVAVPIAGSATVALGIERMGAAGDVILHVANAPAGVTATLASSVIPLGVNAGAVTLRVAAGTQPGTAGDVTITGMSAGREKSVTLNVTARTITVTGAVRGGTPDVTVRIVGKPSVTSGPGGRFVFSDVTPPYDIYALGTLSRGEGVRVPAVSYYQGLTRADPIIEAPQPTPPAFNRTDIRGTASGGVPSNPLLVVWTQGATVSAESNLGASYVFSAAWSPPTDTATGSVYGFQFTTKDGMPDAYTGYGVTSPVTLQGTTATSGPVEALVNLTLQQPATAAITGTFTSPPGFSTPLLQLSHQVGQSGVTVGFAQSSTVDTVIPLVDGGKASLLVSTSASVNFRFAQSMAGYPGLDRSMDLSGSLASPATLLSPGDNDLGIDATTVFMWSNPTAALYQIKFETTSIWDPGPAIYQITTMASTTTIPVVPELPLPKTRAFTWTVAAYTPHDSVDDAAANRPLASPAEASQIFDGRRTTFTSAFSRSFTTTP